MSQLIRASYLSVGAEKKNQKRRRSLHVGHTHGWLGGEEKLPLFQLYFIAVEIVIVVLLPCNVSRLLQGYF